MATPEEFNRRMARLAASAAEGADRVVRKAALAADQAVVMATPVDTGRARANWIAALDAASSEVKGEPSNPGSGANSALTQGRATIAGYDGDENSEIHLTNNLPYIGRLNDGSSRQAPRQFVRTAVEAGIRAVRGATVLP